MKNMQNIETKSAFTHLLFCFPSFGYQTKVTTSKT